ncbi:MAG TPA: MarR family winged helix-turn-helix transcriptional regulator [Roseiarcus sp.]|nr:MarR family winged helix-turn-helix transcriptional regulator [Roseiarcus sp.]
MDIRIEEVLGCTCLRMRRATRRITQIYDHALAPAGVTVNQFGLMAHLYGASLAGRPGFAIHVLAVRLGADPTTLNRTLRPLQENGLIRNVGDPSDRRVRLVQLTDKGRRELAKVMPLWRAAQAQVEKSLGQKSLRELNELLDFAAAKLEPGQ